MNVLKSRWKLLVATVVAIILIQIVTISIAGYTQTQRVETVTSAQSLTFRDQPYIPHLASISGVTLRVRGHIDGSATFDAENWKPQAFSGDVDFSVHRDHFEPELVIRYSPTNVTGGNLSFSVTFN
jgi:hypothetical protein